MNDKTIGLMVMAAGVVLLLVALTADISGLGGAAGFGWKQMTGSAAGAALAALGFFLSRQSGS